MLLMCIGRLYSIILQRADDRSVGKMHKLNNVSYEAGLLMYLDMIESSFSVFIMRSKCLLFRSLYCHYIGILILLSNNI